jgi:hypothetical protein
MSEDLQSNILLAMETVQSPSVAQDKRVQATQYLDALLGRSDLISYLMAILLSVDDPRCVNL